jgi:hypothetical protein
VAEFTDLFYASIIVICFLLMPAKMNKTNLKTQSSTECAYCLKLSYLFLSTEKFNAFYLRRNRLVLANLKWAGSKTSPFFFYFDFYKAKRWQWGITRITSFLSFLLPYLSLLWERNLTCLTQNNKQSNEVLLRLLSLMMRKKIFTISLPPFSSPPFLQNLRRRK